jgi:hypothetical protein
MTTKLLFDLQEALLPGQSLIFIIRGFDKITGNITLERLDRSIERDGGIIPRDLPRPGQILMFTPTAMTAQRLRRFKSLEGEELVIANNGGQHELSLSGKFLIGWPDEAD